MDIKNNSVLASVSRPAMDPSHPFANDAATNMMTTAHIPGSVFKAVTVTLPLRMMLCAMMSYFIAVKICTGNLINAS